MAYWLVKSEPGDWSWADHARAGAAEWDGIRNHQANNNMKAMRVGDLAFFYHSVNEKRIVGILRVTREHYPDPSDASGRFGMVDFTAIMPLPQPVTLAEVKANPALAEIALVRQSRLSVMPVAPGEWAALLAMGGVAPDDPLLHV